MNLKSHFQFSKQQRSGIFLLLLIILFVQGFYHLVLPKLLDTDHDFASNDANVSALIKQIDSLKAIQLEKRKPKIYPFNPNLFYGTIRTSLILAI